MDHVVKQEKSPSFTGGQEEQDAATQARNKNKNGQKEGQATSKRRCVSTACIACRKRKSKCDGNLPKCAACASVYLTECEYAPHTDHRRKGVYKKDTDSLKPKNSTLQILIQALLSHDEDDAIDLLKQMRLADNLEQFAQTVEGKEKGLIYDAPDSPIYHQDSADIPQFDAELSGRMGDLLLDGSVKFIGGTSNLIWLDEPSMFTATSPTSESTGIVRPREEAVLSWTTVTQDRSAIFHLINMYFCWHYSYFTTLSKELFYRDFLTGTSSQYCSALLVNAMLALGCHFSSIPATRADPEDSTTTGDHYFAEAKRLIYENDEFANAKLCTVQALALMSVREAGCGRESRGWVYSGMSFRMASDLGLNVDAPAMNDVSRLSAEDIDARRITYWGCFLFDKCWSNYLGRQPQLQLSHSNTKKFDVFPSEDAELWSPYTDSGIVEANSQPARTRAVALQVTKLAEISSDLMISFYQPSLLEKPMNKQNELKKLSDIHTRLESWRRDLPSEFEPREGQLPSVLLMHMFYQLLYIHLYRPFLKYTKSTSPLPPHISPRKFCTQAAGTISKLLRLYKRTHGLRQVINKVVYIAHSACTIHLLNLPEKNAKRDIVHGVKQLEEIGECWTAARRTLQILFTCAERWKIELPEEAISTFGRAQGRWGSLEINNPSVSPDTFASMTHQINAEPVPDIMAQNVRHHSQTYVQDYDASPPSFHPTPPASHGQTPQSHQSPNQNIQQTVTSQPQQRASFANFHHPQTPDLHYNMGESPNSNIDAGHISSRVSISTPANSEVPRSTGNSSRQSTDLAREQQKAWVAHGRQLGFTLQPTNTPSQRPDQSAKLSTPPNIFGGVEGLMEQSQDWWFNDQNAFAVGFDNWNGPTPDWTGIHIQGHQHTPSASQNARNTSYGSYAGPINNSGIGPMPAIGPNGLFTSGVSSNSGGGIPDINYSVGAYGMFTTPRKSTGGEQTGNTNSSHGKRSLSWDDDDMLY